MSNIDSVRQRIDVPTIGLAIITLLSIFVVPVVTLVSVIAFDATGLDEVVPAIVFVNVLPPMLVALFPTGVASYLYDKTTAVKLGVGIAIVSFVAVTAGCWTTAKNAIC